MDKLLILFKIPKAGRKICTISGAYWEFFCRIVRREPPEMGRLEALLSGINLADVAWRLMMAAEDVRQVCAGGGNYRQIRIWIELRMRQTDRGLIRGHLRGASP